MDKLWLGLLIGLFGTLIIGWMFSKLKFYIYDSPQKMRLRRLSHDILTITADTKLAKMAVRQDGFVTFYCLFGSGKFLTLNFDQFELHLSSCDTSSPNYNIFGAIDPIKIVFIYVSNKYMGLEKSVGDLTGSKRWTIEYERHSKSEEGPSYFNLSDSVGDCARFYVDKCEYYTDVVKSLLVQLVNYERVTDYEKATETAAVTEKVVEKLKSSRRQFKSDELARFSSNFLSAMKRKDSYFKNSGVFDPKEFKEKFNAEFDEDIEHYAQKMITDSSSKNSKVARSKTEEKKTTSIVAK